MSGPSPTIFRAKVFRDREHTGNWRVERLCEDCESIKIAIFQRRRCATARHPVRRPRIRHVRPEPRPWCQELLWRLPRPTQIYASKSFG
jgi:hypothetical protein